MHHPGPPRFVSVGDSVELAPRDPDPDASYDWSIDRAPAASDVDLSEDPVQRLSLDEPGEYVVALSAPDGTHTQTIRCFPGDATSQSRPVARSGQHSGGTLDAGEEGEGHRSGYGHATPPVQDGEGGRPRIHLAGHLEEGEFVVEADPRPHPESDEAPRDLEVAYIFDDRDALSTEDATRSGHDLRIPVERLPQQARIHAVAVGEDGHSVADALDVRRDDLAELDAAADEDDGGVRALETTDSEPITVRRMYQPPAWGTDAVYYEIYVRTFDADSEKPTLQAIRERLDHVEDLGVDVIWLTPVLANDHAPHGYNITDFFSIAEDLGTREDLQALVEEAHDRGMRVLFDLVLNHTAREHPYFQDAYGNPDSEYRKWYDWQDNGEPETYFDWEYIANFDFGTLEVRRHLLDAIDEWAPLVDGFRCDMAWAVPDTFWREVRDRAKSHDRAFLLLDETIPYIADFHEGMFEVHFDSTTYASLRSVGTGYADASALLDAVEERTDVGFPDHAGYLLYAENHDETRFIVEADRPAARAAAGALCTLPGAPLVYAGQETAQLGKRDDIQWDVADESLIEHYRQLIALRQEMPALQAGADLVRVDFEVVDGAADRVLAFGRVDPAAADAAETIESLAGRIDGDAPREAGAAIVVCNFGEEPAEVALGPDAVGIDAAFDADVGGQAGSVADAAGVRRDGNDVVRVDDVVVLPTVPSALPDRD